MIDIDRAIFEIPPTPPKPTRRQRVMRLGRSKDNSNFNMSSEIKSEHEEKFEAAGSMHDEKFDDAGSMHDEKIREDKGSSGQKKSNREEYLKRKKKRKAKKKAMKAKEA